ncbi:MAG: hypothetical protein QOE58_153 [Actinomycetota bacterium]|nr:hypothetical protein [Actinomycetota bacterium]
MPEDSKSEDSKPANSKLEDGKLEDGKLEDGKPGTPFERWARMAGSSVAPATAVSGLLFYFGYVSSRSQYEYFGLDVDTIGLTTQDFVMRSPQPLLVPLLVLSVLGAVAVLVHAVIRARLRAAFAEPAPAPAARARTWTRRATAMGLFLLVAGFVLLFLYPLLSEWQPFNLVTPVIIALGGSVSAYALSAARFVADLESSTAAPAAPPATTASTATTATTAGSRSVWLRPAVSVFILLAVAASIFWATATVAQWSGVGLAQNQARHLTELPSVILDTRERLYLTSPGLSEVALPPSTGQTFHYRYRSLRLLIQGHDRMFLVPDQWSASDSTLMVRVDPSVRLQFQFRNQPP